MLHRPYLRVDPTATKKDAASRFAASKESHDEYPHTSVFRSSQIEIHVRSPLVKVVRRRGSETARSMPVFGDHDKVAGTVLLDVRVCSMPGRLAISMEGAFIYLSPGIGMQEGSSDLHPSERHRHVFFSSSLVNPVGEVGSPRSATSLREAFAASVRSKGRERRPSQADMKGALRPFPFSFDIPRPSEAGQELPPTFSSLAEGETGPRGRACVERAEVTYKITATWEASDGSNRIQLEAPLIFQPEADFQSLDGLSLEPESWLEVPLRSDRPIPLQCAVTLPDPATFSRSGSIPYFVVFTTTPRSPALAREVAADATIAVSLLREVSIDAPPPGHPPSPISTPSTSSDESDCPRATKRRLLKRMVKSAPPILSRSRANLREKPLPDLPAAGTSEMRALHTDVCIGFPKRPRYPHQRHPSLDIHASLPDGLYKGRMQLDKHMLPNFDWAGLRVKYFLEISVLFGQDEMRARVPLRIS